MHRLIALACSGALCLGALAACGDDSDSSGDVQKANAAYCQDLTTYGAAVNSFIALGPTATKAQYKDAADDVKSAREDLTDSAKKLSEATVSNLQSDVDKLKDDLKDAPDDQSVAAIVASAAPQAAKVKASAAAVNTAVCTPSNASTTAKS
jgi:hypothetical protein